MNTSKPQLLGSRCGQGGGGRGGRLEHSVAADRYVRNLFFVHSLTATAAKRSKLPSGEFAALAVAAVLVLLH